MSPAAILVIFSVILVVVVLLIFLLGLPVGGEGAKLRSSLRSMVNSQRMTGGGSVATDKPRNTKKQEYDDEGTIETVTKLSLRKRLKYAGIPHLPPYVFAMSQIVISLITFIAVRSFFGVILQIYSLAAGPVIMNAVLTHMVKKRFTRFDNDYPQFLLSLVGLLKTGMNPIQALEAAVEALDPDSLVRSEIELMIERLRLGVPEERSVGSFGEDINHPEIELFVQALTLSRRLGGVLSDTLERLSKQVRKRQQFRRAANAAVGLQRGSMWFILGILAFIEFYLYMSWPQSVVDVWFHPIGKMIGEGCICSVLTGLYWMRRVTEIKT